MFNKRFDALKFCYVFHIICCYGVVILKSIIKKNLSCYQSIIVFGSMLKVSMMLTDYYQGLTAKMRKWLKVKAH